MTGHRRALLVSPSYAAPGLDDRTRYVLQQAGVLPLDLGKYSTEGFARDAAVLRRQLGQGFSWDTLEGEVLAKTVVQRLEWLLSRDTEVAVLLFCGHGVWQGSPQHGNLVCSFKQLVSAEAIERVATEARFSGTFVRLLNMCEAEGSPAAQGEPVRQEAQGARDEARLQAAQMLTAPQPPGAPPAYCGLTVAATHRFGKTGGKSTGSVFGAALGRVFEQEVLVTYEDFEAALAKQWHGAQVRTTHAFRGVFGAPAIPVRCVVPPMHPHVATSPCSQSESDSELDVEWGAVN